MAWRAAIDRCVGYWLIPIFERRVKRVLASVTAIVDEAVVVPAVVVTRVAWTLVNVWLDCRAHGVPVPTVHNWVTIVHVIVELERILNGIECGFSLRVSG